MAIERHLVLTVDNDKASLNEKVTIYRQDGDLCLCIKVESYKWQFNSKLRYSLIEETEGFKYASATVLKPDTIGFPVEKSQIVGDEVHIEFTKEMINDFIEVGQWYIQLHLWNETEDRVTIPPFEVTVKDTIANVWGNPQADYSKADEAVLKETQELELFGDTVPYEPTQWEKGMVISSSKLNKMEQGIGKINEQVVSILDQIEESDLMRLKSLIELLQQNKLGITDKASDSTLLNGVSEDMNATNNSIVKRTPSGNVVAKYGYGFGETGELGSVTVDSNLDRLQHHAIDGSIYPIWDHKNFPVEYGKFTPYIYGLTSGKKLISETSTVFGRYMRVGRMVYVDLRIVWNGKNGVGESEQVGIAGLPFAPKYAYGSLNIGLYHGIGINLAETSLATYTDASGIKLFVNTKSNWGGLTAVHLATAGSIEMSGHYFIESV